MILNGSLIILFTHSNRATLFMQNALAALVVREYIQMSASAHKGRSGCYHRHRHSSELTSATSCCSVVLSLLHIRPSAPSRPDCQSVERGWREPSRERRGRFLPSTASIVKWSRPARHITDRSRGSRPGDKPQECRSS